MNRIWHPWNKWECYKEGFYNSCSDIGISKEDAQFEYRDFLSCLWQFETALNCVINQWVYSCEHFLSNTSSNRIAWLGQASLAYAKGLPSEARGGFKLMTVIQQDQADNMALYYLNVWENKHDKKNKRICKKMERAWLSRGYSR